MSTWDEAREAKLKELWEKGHTASQIAEILGGTTRNAVIGKAHRLKLAGRAQSKKLDKKEKRSVGGESKEERQISRRSRFKSLLLDKNFEPENPKSLEELTEETCKWPIGHPNEEKFYFCGRKPEGEFPYCKLHVLYAFQPKNQKEDDLDEDIPEIIEKKVKSAG